MSERTTDRLPSDLDTLNGRFAPNDVLLWYSIAFILLARDGELQRRVPDWCSFSMGMLSVKGRREDGLKEAPLGGVDSFGSVRFTNVHGHIVEDIWV